MEQVSPLALSTLARVKDLLFDPSSTIQLTCSTTTGSPTLASVVLPAGKVLRIGQSVSGPGIAAGTTIAAFASGIVTLSSNATADATGAVLYVVDQPVAYDIVLTRMINSVSDYIFNECGVTGFVQQTYVNDTYSANNASQCMLMLRNTPVFSISSLQYRAGTPSNPSWTDFLADEYELINPRTDPSSGLIYYPSGTVRIYGTLPSFYNNMVRATYVAGYPVDWPNAGNGDTHMLPADLSGLCENLVVRRFKRRQLAGQGSQALEGATTSWRNDLDAEDKDVIDQHKQLHF